MRVVVALVMSLFAGGQTEPLHWVIPPASAGAPLVVPAPEPPGGLFEFKGFKAGVNTDLRQLPMDKCHFDERRKTLDCTYDNESVAGWTGSITYKFNGAKLYQVLIILGARAHRDVTEAFNAKYGNPCSEDLTSTVWCFRTGKMTVFRYLTSDPRNMGAIYTDDDEPDVKPKVDF